jgi:hypothetical protein
MYENEEFLLSIEIQFDTNYLFYNTYTPNVPITCARLRWYMKMEMIWFPLSFWFSTEKWSTCGQSLFVLFGLLQIKQIDFE